MKRLSRSLAVLSGVFLLASAGVVAAQSADPVRDPINRADLNCMAVTAVLGDQTEEGSDEQIGLLSVLTWYLGRLEARAPGVNWLEQVLPYLDGDPAEMLKTHGERCAAEIMTFGERLADWSARAEALAAKHDSAGKR
ncbi:MAG: hypothetical protein EBR82_06190 [Caulobacteraceae bacterium]|nr:hypothetical protein [Caulobacteraceae bacterium]